MSVSDLAELFDCDRATVRRRCRGLDRKNGPRGSVLYRSIEALPRMAGVDDTEKPSAQRDRQQARLAQHRANLAELQELEQRGQLVPVAECERIMGAIVGVVRGRLMALPVRLAGELPVKVSVRRQAEQSLKDNIYAALQEMSTELQGTVVQHLSDEVQGKGKS